MEMLTPRDDTRSPALFIEPPGLTDTVEQAARGSLYHHPNGCRRITAVGLVSPKTYEPIAPLTYLRAQHILGLEQGDQWLLVLTFDGGERKQTRDLGPNLPILVRY